MRVQCAWCKKEMGEKPPYDDQSTSHNICNNCLAKELKSAYRLMAPSQEFRQGLLRRLMREAQDPH